MKKIIEGVLDSDYISTAEFVNESSVVDILLLRKNEYQKLDKLIESFYEKKVRITIETID